MKNAKLANNLISNDIWDLMGGQNLSRMCTFPHFLWAEYPFLASRFHEQNWHFHEQNLETPTVGVHMLNMLTVSTCSTGSVHMLNWKHAHAQLEAYTYAQLEVCTCSTGSMHMAYAQWEGAHAQLEACTCTTGSIHMLNWKCPHTQLEVCTCSWSFESVHMLEL